MQRDQHGLETTAACAEAVRLYDRTILHFLGLRADTGDRLRDVFQADPDMPMAHCARGYFMKLFCTPPMERKAAKSLAEAERLSARGTTARERLHVAALAAWCAGDIAGATDRWETILLEHPCDVLALRLGHFTHFYLGDSEGMRDSVARVLPYWDPAAPGYGFVLGYHAFGLEETGRYDEAEAAGRCAVEINPSDIWSAHAVAHVMEMRGEAPRRRGLAFWAGPALGRLQQLPLSRLVAPLPVPAGAGAVRRGARPLRYASACRQIHRLSGHEQRDCPSLAA